jgi:hypothetical protein
VRYGTCGVELSVMIVSVSSIAVVRCDPLQRVEIDDVRNGSMMVDEALLLLLSRSLGLFGRSG